MDESIERMNQSIGKKDLFHVNQSRNFQANLAENLNRARKENEKWQ